jgi:hypothetical protein
MKTMETPQLGVERGSSSGKEQAGRAKHCEQVQIRVLAGILGEDIAGKEADESETDEEKESGSTGSIRLPSLKLQVVVG